MAPKLTRGPHSQQGPPILKPQQQGDVGAGVVQEPNATQPNQQPKLTRLNRGRGGPPILVQQVGQLYGVYEGIVNERVAALVPQQPKLFAIGPFSDKGPPVLVRQRFDSFAAVTGSGGFIAAAAAFSDSAVERFIGSGGVTAAAAAFSGTSLEKMRGSGGVTAAAASFSGTAREDMRATGAFTASAASFTGTGKLREISTGAIAAAAASFASTALERFVATGAITAAAAALAGTGDTDDRGTGSFTAQAPTFDGTGSSGVVVLPDTPVVAAGWGTANEAITFHVPTPKPGVVSGAGGVAAAAASVAGTAAISTPDEDLALVALLV